MAQIGSRHADHCARWEHLEIAVPDPLTFLHELEMPSLRSLKVAEGETTSLTVTPVFLAPLLQKVALEIYLDPYDPLLPWLQLTVLSLGWIDRNQFVDILNRLVNIIYIRFLMHGKSIPRCSLQELCIPNFSGSVSRSIYHAALPTVTSFIFNSGGKLDDTEPFLEESYNLDDTD
ncbi:hypothetical protein B0H13DRAFT_1872955 [Mycena leptocephala]|nr:hypothetical protein B0H13DRAFT_1872955 [Mycena leptocephala]